MASYLVIPADEPGRKLLERYLKRRRSDVALVRKLLGDGDFEHVRRLGHNWFGSGAAYELPRISLLGERLELAAERHDTDTAAGIADDMDAFLDTVVIGPPSGVEPTGL